MTALVHCTICSDKHPAFVTRQFKFGIRDVAFCGSCWHHLEGVVNAPDADTQAAHRLIDELSGIRRVVINVCHGGFGLSYAALLRYLELRGIEFSLHPRGDQHSTRMFGPEIHVGGQPWDADNIDRDDETLVRIVQEMGSEANGRDSDLRVVEIPADVDWMIRAHVGREWVCERHQTWF